MGTTKREPTYTFFGNALDDLQRPLIQLGIGGSCIFFALDFPLWLLPPALLAVNVAIALQLITRLHVLVITMIATIHSAPATVQDRNPERRPPSMKFFEPLPHERGWAHNNHGSSKQARI